MSMMNVNKTIAKGSAWSLFSNISTKLISFVYTIIIARLLLTEEIGTFYLVLSILGILFVFTDFGIIYSLNRYVPFLYGKREFGKLRSLIELSYFFGGIFTFVFSIFIFIFSTNISEIIGQPSITPILQIMSILLLLKEIDNINRGILTGRKKMKESKMLVTTQNFMKLILTVIAFYMIGLNAEALSVGFLLSFLLVIPVGLCYVFQEMKTWEKQEMQETITDRIRLGKEVASFGIIVTLITTMGTIIQYTDRIMLGHLTENALDKIAIYSIALGLANLVLVFPTAVTGIFFPVVSELYGKNNMKAMNETVSVSMKWLIMIMIPLALIIGIFGDILLGLFYGDVYEAGAVVLLLFVAGLFLRSVFSLPQLILSAMRKLDVELKAVSVAAVANVILNVILIPIWGINGAAMASMISFIIVSIMIAYYSRKIFNFSFPKEAYKPLIAGLLALVIILLLKETLTGLIDEVSPMIQGMFLQYELFGEIAEKLVKFLIFGLLFLLSVFIYFVALLLLKSFGKEELDILAAAMRKARIPEGYIAWTRNFLEAKWFKLPRT